MNIKNRNNMKKEINCFCHCLDSQVPYSTCSRSRNNGSCSNGDRIKSGIEANPEDEMIFCECNGMDMPAGHCNKFHQNGDCDTLARLIEAAHAKEKKAAKKQAAYFAADHEWTFCNCKDTQLQIGSCECAHEAHRKWVDENYK